MTYKDISVQDFEAFEIVKKSEIYNLISDGAERASGLSHEKYYFILENYTRLLIKYNNKELHVDQ